MRENVPLGCNLGAILEFLPSKRPANLKFCFGLVSPKPVKNVQIGTRVEVVILEFSLDRT
jgi:hypothetical protein